MSELERATKEARSISGTELPPREEDFVGARVINNQKHYFYRQEDGYVYETDFDREMRKKTRKNRFKRNAKNSIPIGSRNARDRSHTRKF